MPRLLFSFYFTDSFENVIEVLNKGIQELDQEISPKLPKDKKIQHRAEILESFNGIGKNTAALIISQMPKLGSANNRQIAAIAGLAPYNQDGGKRSIRGGRKISRNALYMVALVATRHNLPIKQYYNRLVENKKCFKQTIATVMRKISITINSMIKNNQKWNLNFSTQP